MGKQVWLCGEAKAIHAPESTRAHFPGQSGNSEDLLRLRSRYHDFLAAASAEQLKLLLRQQQAESHQLRELVQQREAQPTEAMLELMQRYQELNERHAQLNERHAQLNERHAQLNARHAQLVKRHAEDELELRQLRQDALAIEALQEERLRLKARLMAWPAASAELDSRP